MDSLMARESMMKAKPPTSYEISAILSYLFYSILYYLYFFAALFKSFVRDCQRFVRDTTLKPEAGYLADVARSAPALE
jgi:hypothetical protein